MALTGSYLDVAEASAYFTTRLYTAAWTAATDDTVRAAALVMATRAVDRLPLAGVPVDPEQPLAFPRVGLPATAGLAVNGVVPQAVLDAVCEEALALLARGDSRTQQQQREGIVGYTNGPLSITYASGQAGRPRTTGELLSPEAAALMARFRADIAPVATVQVRPVVRLAARAQAPECD